MHFRIEQWRAWAPGLDSTDDWRAWCRTPVPLEDAQQQPDVGFLPALQRRRLSRLARMMFHVAWPLAEGHRALPLVFASRHGDAPRTLALLEQLASGEPLSPTQFSLSVHNATIGLWSILRGDTSEMSALAAAGDGLEQALLEACSLLGDGAPAVLLVLAEEMPPPLYAAQVDDVPFPYAVALLLTPGQDWRLQLHAGSGPRADWPHALNLLRALCGERHSLEHHWKNRRWIWSPTTA
ncbi:beta-ketoacyl synthase chain length factor [Pseudomonas lalucatii]|uniref:Beta-ketoacyl synthase chain length factor n=1 Tax=Pseudomonas lalucatii TaxID=1424203 RepID=A0ABS5Q0I6_9PSED|nr:beta-ketoacyl synthase chain length factor [Pseudomonas lalucatii]MBS7662288.1 beta-ketoacyl synthase chain length factor [Pseudomonas lalucatii]MBS7726004.1 beta-ketoacyl synthase chain length factor [Pseudomonas lalucatii]QVM88418.1 beta-ketoacyl synthase chain length factor [Pseudomonas lalucatii]